MKAGLQAGPFFQTMQKPVQSEARQGEACWQGGQSTCLFARLMEGQCHREPIRTQVGPRVGEETGSVVVITYYLVQLWSQASLFCMSK